MIQRILVLHGPNLNWRQVDGLPLPALDEALHKAARELKAELKIFQSNHEGALLDRLYAERDWLEGAVICPTSLGTTCHSLVEGVKLLGKPVVEMVLDPKSSASSLLKAVVERQYVGQGVGGYLQAIKDFAGRPAEKTLGPKPALEASRAPESHANGVAVVKTLGRGKPREPEKKPGAKKTIGNASSREPSPSHGAISRALVRQKIADRLGGKLSPSGLATWARTQWQLVQRGAPAESGQREMLEDALQTLLLSATPSAGVKDEHLIDLMAQLDSP